MRSVVVVALALATSRLAAAQPAVEPALAPPGLAPLVEPAEPKPEVVQGSYRLQIAASDAIATALLFSSNSSSSVAPTLALATYAFAPAAIHLAHGHGARALGSVGLRTLLPVLGGAIGSSLGGGSNDFDGALAGLVFGGLGGAIAASAIDIGALGAAEYADRPAHTIAPSVTRSQNGTMSFGVAGSF